MGECRCPTPSPQRASSYRPVPPQIDLPAMEHEVLAFWEREKTFAKSVAASTGKPVFILKMDGESLKLDCHPVQQPALTVD